MKMVAKSGALIAFMVILAFGMVWIVRGELDTPYVYKRSGSATVVFVEVVQNGEIVRKPPSYLHNYDGVYHVKWVSPSAPVMGE